MYKENPQKTVRKAKNKAQKKAQKKAFTLIELSMVIIIASLLISTSLSSSLNSIKNTKEKISKARMEEIYQALGNYLLVNKRLPCPASLKKSKLVDADYGTAVAVSGGTCAGAGVYVNGNYAYGMVPILDLGLMSDMAEDGFESKFSYVVDKNMVAISTFDTSNGSIVVKEKRSYGLTTITSQAAFALISHGDNQLNAYPSVSSVRNNDSPESDETENSFTIVNDAIVPPTANYDANYYSVDSNNERFDDFMYYKTKKQMVLDFGALSILSCSSASSSTSLYGTIITWPQAYYGQVPTANTSCPTNWTNGVLTPTRRCGAFGVWDQVIEPCAPNT